MPDLVLREANGWHEITDLLDLGRLDEAALWGAAGQGNWVQADQLLWDALNPDFEKRYVEILGEAPPKALYVVKEPDDIRGEWLRVWAQRQV